MNLPMKLSSEKEIEIVEEGFLDSGAGGKFIDQHYVKMKKLEKERLSEPIKVYNVPSSFTALSHGCPFDRTNCPLS